MSIPDLSHKRICKILCQDVAISTAVWVCALCKCIPFNSLIVLLLIPSKLIHGSTAVCVARSVGILSK